MRRGASGVPRHACQAGRADGPCLAHSVDVPVDRASHLVRELDRCELHDRVHVGRRPHLDPHASTLGVLSGLVDDREDACRQPRRMRGRGRACAAWAGGWRARSAPMGTRRGGLREHGGQPVGDGLGAAVGAGPGATASCAAWRRARRSSSRLEIDRDTWAAMTSCAGSVHGDRTCGSCPVTGPAARSAAARRGRRPHRRSRHMGAARGCRAPRSWRPRVRRPQDSRVIRTSTSRPSVPGPAKIPRNGGTSS